MSGVAFQGNLEGGSALLAGGLRLGEVRHSIRIYQDTRHDITIAAGKIWCDHLVLEKVEPGQSLILRLEDGADLRVVVQRKSPDSRFFYAVVDGSIPGF